MQELVEAERQREATRATKSRTSSFTELLGGVSAFIDIDGSRIAQFISVRMKGLLSLSLFTGWLVTVADGVQERNGYGLISTGSWTKLRNTGGAVSCCKSGVAIR